MRNEEMIEIIPTRLTRTVRIVHPVISAPMAVAAGGRLAAAVSQAGGLGLIGGGYADMTWVAAELDAAGDTPVGCGFITWSLARSPEVLDLVLERAPRAVMLSFGDPRALGARVREAGVPLICQAGSPPRRCSRSRRVPTSSSPRAPRRAATESTRGRRSRSFQNSLICSRTARRRPCCARPAGSPTAAGSRPR
jgi:hypothetical protein